MDFVIPSRPRKQRRGSRPTSSRSGLGMPISTRPKSMSTSPSRVGERSWSRQVYKSIFTWPIISARSGTSSTTITLAVAPNSVSLLVCDYQYISQVRRGTAAYQNKMRYYCHKVRIWRITIRRFCPLQRSLDHAAQVSVRPRE